MTEIRRLVLLGAGASVDAGVPTANQMTRDMVSALGAHGETDLTRALLVIVGGLQLGAGWEREPATLEVDIERVINAARLLADRFDAELSPFVGNWHPALEELERHSFQRGLRARFRDLPTSMPRRLSLEQAQAALSSVLKEIDSRFKSLLEMSHRRPDGRLFNRLCAALTDNLVRFAWITNKEAVRYLEPLLLAAAHEQFPIATLNYDNGIELCGTSLGMTCDTGLERWQSTGVFADTSAGKIGLIKLHGSIDWSWQRASKGPPIVIKQAEDAMCSAKELGMRRRGWQSDDSDVAVVFGGKNKLTAAGPFLDLFFWFRESMQAARELIAIGYSFRDDHVNHAIRSWLARSDAHKMTIITNPENRYFEGYEFQKLGFESSKVQTMRVGARDGIRELFHQSD